MVDPVLTTAAITAALASGGIGALKKSLGSAFERLADRAKTDAAAGLSKWKARKAISAAADRLFQLRMVKTIWQIDRPVDITEFYYPSRLRLGSGKAVTANRLVDIPHVGNVIVQGTVGQGKSIFLRHLATWEALDGVRLPLFVELRRILADDTLESHLLSELSTLGIPRDAEVFAYLASTGQISLLLDAFDEVREERRERLIGELETLARTYPELRIIITSRQNSGIERSALWTVVQLVPFEGDEYEAVVRRICHDEKISGPMIAGLRTETGRRIAPMLTTPLMVALLVLRYRAEQSIPETRADFFSDLFMLLLQRHDKTKAGYIRQRKSKLGDKFLERVFVALCYLTKKSGESVFSNAAMFDLTREALAASGGKGDADVDAVLDDVRLITCLLLEEGGEWRFIHQFVQEYHAACFIASFEDVAAQKFYAAMVAAPERCSAWREELGFLQSIDAYRAAKLYLIPMLEKLFGAGATAYDARAISDTALGWVGTPSPAARERAPARKRGRESVPLVMVDQEGFGAWFVFRLIELGFPYARLADAIGQALGGAQAKPTKAAVSPWRATLRDLGCHEHPLVQVEGRSMAKMLWDDLGRARAFVKSVESRRALVSF
jgi:NACHT domain